MDAGFHPRHGPAMPPTDCILIIEEETLLALDIEFVLSEDGPVEVTHYRSVTEAEAHTVDPTRFHLALVEAKLGAPAVVALTQRLVQAGLPTVVMSADRASLSNFPHAQPLEKPFDAASLKLACDAAKARIS